jgi:opacity protein-like surface antigen
MLAACAVVALGAASARADSGDVRASRAHRRDRAHVYAGLFGSAYLVAAQATDYRRGYLDHGGGGGLFGGVRLNRRFSVEAGVRTTVHGENFARARVTNLPLDRLVLTTLGVGGRLHLPTGTIFEPYAGAGAGYAIVAADFVECPDCDTVFAAGPQAELGAGVDVQVYGRISAGLRATGQVMYFGSDAFEKRLRVQGFEPSRTRTTILSMATDAYAAFHF